MDPLSIISLTGNIAQFISIGYGILSTARELYNAPDDSADSLRTIRLLAEDVKRSIVMISKDIPDVAQSGEERALQDISKECGQLADGVLAQIEKLRIDGEGLLRKLRALRVSATFRFKKKEIDEMLARLIALEARLRTWWFPTNIYRHSITGQNNVIIAIRSDLSQLKRTTNRLDIGQSVLSGLEAKLDQILANIESLEDGSAISARRDALEGIALNSRNYKDETSKMKRHHRILEALIFDSIYSREEKIEFAHVKTLEWLFDSPITNFRAWLETGSGVYWMNGLVSTDCTFVSKIRLRNTLLIFFLVRPAVASLPP